MSDQSNSLADQDKQPATKANSTATTNGIQPASDPAKADALQSNELQSSNEHLADQPDGSKASKAKKKKKNKKSGATESATNDRMSEPAADEQSLESPNSVNNDRTESVNDQVNSNIDDKPLDSVNVQIDSSTTSHPTSDIRSEQANGDQSEQPKATVDAQEIKVDAKDEDEAKESRVDEQTKLLENEQSKQTNGHLDRARQNGKQAPPSLVSSTEDVHEGIPELLLTENNQPNHSGISSKLIVAAILLFKFITYFIIKIIALFHPAKRNRLPPVNEPLLLLTAEQISEKIKNGELKCEHVIRAYIHRIETVQPKLNAVIDDCFDEAIKRAKEVGIRPFESQTIQMSSICLQIVTGTNPKRSPTDR